MKFSMLFHAHQPPDNYDFVFREAVERSYGPFLGLLEALPDVRVSAHFSGSLLEWLESHDPAVIRRLQALVARGQVEMVAAGIQEPVLALLPPRDRAHQVLAHRATLRRLFGVDATVGWLTERVWTPEIAGDLAAAGIRAVPLDEGHFVAAGIPLEELVGPFTTEWLGRPLTLVPALDAIRASVPWSPVREVLGEVRTMTARGEVRLLTFADDLEKFGLWPGTFRSVWERGWLSAFFEGLLASPGVELVPLGEALATEPPGPRVYLPDGSYPEMLAWSMTPPSQRALAAARGRLQARRLWTAIAPFVHPGLYFQFLAKYPEANYFHKRMLDVSDRVARVHPPASVARNLDDPPEAVRQLWRAQANCPYWHGWFGGTYLPVLRQQVFRSLLRAERALEASGERRRLLRVFDLDADGRDEALVTTEAMVVGVAPADGGAIVEWSDRRQAVNLADTIARRAEVYHDADAPPYPNDPGRRGILCDRFLAAGPLPARRSEIEDRGDFVGSEYRMSARTVQNHARIVLDREGSAPGGRVHVEKTLTVPDGGGAGGAAVQARYRLTGVSGLVDARFGIEANFGVCFAHDFGGRVTAGGRTFDARRGGAVRAATRLDLTVDEPNIGASIETDRAADIDVRPLTTVSGSEHGLERIQQAVTCLLTWPVRLAPGERFEVTVDLALADAPGASP
jgi:hypothetical protein